MPRSFKLLRVAQSELLIIRTIMIIYVYVLLPSSSCVRDIIQCQSLTTEEAAQKTIVLIHFHLRIMCGSFGGHRLTISICPK